jgi:hypothetical protein
VGITCGVQDYEATLPWFNKETIERYHVHNSLLDRNLPQMTLPINPTPNVGLSRPNFNLSTWHDYVNDNFLLIDTIFAAIGFPAVDGTWANNTAYDIGDRVYDPDDASFWLCGFAHTSAVSGSFADDRLAHPGYWSQVDTGLTVRGAWISGGTLYRTGDVVYDTSQYVVAVANVDHTSTTDIRTDETLGYWTFIADLKTAVTTANNAATAAAASAAEAAEIVGGDLYSIITGASTKSPLDGNDRFLVSDSVGLVVKAVTYTQLEDQLSTDISSGLTVAFGSLTGVPTTVAGYGITDAYTKTEVDGFISTAAANVGKRGRVRCASASNVTIATGLVAGQVIDGVTLVNGDQVLLKNQTTTAQNGVYVVSASPARASEYDTYDEHPGSLIAVEEGTTNADTLWLCTSNNGGTLGTTAITFNKMAVAGELLAANNLSDVASASTARTNLGVDTAILTAQGQEVGYNAQTGNYTLVLGDAGKFVAMNVAGANTLTVPPNSSVAFPINTRIDLGQYGAGQVTITPGSGVTIRSADSKLKTNKQYSGGTLIKIGTDEWWAFGDLVA